MAFCNMVYIAQLTNRIPIIPAFTPTHVGRDGPWIAFGDVFDVPRMQKDLRMPVLEWRDVKLLEADGGEWDALGCWSAWSPYDDLRHGLPRENPLEKIYSLDVSYTTVPAGTKLMADPNDKHTAFWPLARLGFPNGHNDGIREHPDPFQSTGPGKFKIPPDQQLLCYDFLYYVAAACQWEWQEEYSPAWRVASSIHFAPRMIDMANGYLKRLFGVQRTSDIPHFISIHVRHGDFKNQCYNNMPLVDCFASLAIIGRRVKEVQSELWNLGGGHDESDLPVLMTSDEQDPAWWEEVKGMGWYFVDHGPSGEDTSNVHGAWYPPLLDAVFQSMGAGFVGTDGSTMSLVAQRRVEDWNHGPTRNVNWRRIGADDH